jgi:hypothetical protein
MRYLFTYELCLTKSVPGLTDTKHGCAGTNYMKSIVIACYIRQYGTAHRA